MICDFKKKVRCVLTILQKNDFRVSQTGYRINSSSQKTATTLINELRRVRDIHSQMYDSNFSAYLHDPRRAPFGFLAELTAAFGLDELGLDEGIWEQEIEDIRERIEDALRGGVLTKVLSHPLDQSLFEIHTPVPKGILFPDDEHRKGQQDLSYPELIVEVGSEISCTGRMPFDGFMVVIALENGEFIGLNSLLDIPNQPLSVGQHTFETFETDPVVARTVLFSFACSHDVFEGWPKAHLKSHRISQGLFLALISAFYANKGVEIASNVQSFVTTVGGSPQR